MHAATPRQAADTGSSRGGAGAGRNAERRASRVEGLGRLSQDPRRLERRRAARRRRRACAGHRTVHGSVRDAPDGLKGAATCNTQPGVAALMRGGAA